MDRRKEKKNDTIYFDSKDTKHDSAKERKETITLCASS